MNLTRNRLSTEALPLRKTKKSAILRKAVTYGMSLKNPYLEDINSVIVITFQVRTKFILKLFFPIAHELCHYYGTCSFDAGQNKIIALLSDHVLLWQSNGERASLSNIKFTIGWHLVDSLSFFLSLVDTSLVLVDIWL